jgi:hypothetical protein
MQTHAALEVKTGRSSRDHPRKRSSAEGAADYTARPIRTVSMDAATAQRVLSELLEVTRIAFRIGRDD